DPEDEQQHVPADDDRDEPPRHDSPDGESDERREDEEPVRGGIEQLSKPRDLVEPSRKDPVEKVGEARDHEHDEGEHVLAHDDEHEEDRYEGEPYKAQDVRDRED